MLDNATLCEKPQLKRDDDRMGKREAAIFGFRVLGYLGFWRVSGSSESPTKVGASGKVMKEAAD